MASFAGEAAGSARASAVSAVSAAVPFCEQGTRKRADYIDSPDGHLVELWGRVFRTCNGVEGLPNFFLVAANPDALPGLRFPYTLLELAVFSPFSPAAPSGEWSTDMRISTRTLEGGPIERRTDRVIGDVVYEQYLIYGFLPDGTLIPAFVSFIPVPGSDAPDHRFGCTGPVVGLLHRDESYCWMWLRYKGLYAHIGFSRTKDFPDPIPIEPHYTTVGVVEGGEV